MTFWHACMSCLQYNPGRTINDTFLKNQLQCLTLVMYKTSTFYQLY